MDSRVAENLEKQKNWDAFLEAFQKLKNENKALKSKVTKLEKKNGTSINDSKSRSKS